MKNSTGEPQREIVLDLIGLIYDAVADASRWQIFLEALARAIGASKATLLLRDVGGPTFAAVCWCGWSDEDMSVYNEKYARIDPWNSSSVTWPESAVGTDVELCLREEMEASAAYQEFYLPLDAVHGMGATIVVTETGRSVFAAVRGTDAGPFGDLEKELVRQIVPHLKRAALLHGELGSLRRQLAAVTGQLAASFIRSSSRTRRAESFMPTPTRGMSRAGRPVSTWTAAAFRCEARSKMRLSCGRWPNYAAGKASLSAGFW